jgi:hypothetical protein
MPSVYKKKYLKTRNKEVHLSIIKIASVVIIYLSLFWSDSAQAYIQLYTCRTHNVSIDGGATWTTRTECEPAGVIGRPMDHSDYPTIREDWLPPTYEIDKEDVTAAEASKTCTEENFKGHQECLTASVHAASYGTAACFISAYTAGPLVGPWLAAICELGVVNGKNYIDRQCDLAKFNADNACPKP